MLTEFWKYAILAVPPDVARTGPRGRLCQETESDVLRQLFDSPLGREIGIENKAIEIKVRAADIHTRAIKGAKAGTLTLPELIESDISRFRFKRPCENGVRVSIPGLFGVKPTSPYFKTPLLLR